MCSLQCSSRVFANDATAGNHALPGVQPDSTEFSGCCPCREPLRLGWTPPSAGGGPAQPSCCDSVSGAGTDAATDDSRTTDSRAGHGRAGQRRAPGKEGRGPGAGVMSLPGSLGQDPGPRTQVTAADDGVYHNSSFNVQSLVSKLPVLFY